MALVDLDPQFGQQPEVIFRNLEEPNWAPWLRFAPEDLALHRMVFPDGQITRYDELGTPIASLDTNRVNWSGRAADLTTWDDVAGVEEGYVSAYQAEGNTIALLSMSVHPNVKKSGVATSLISEIVERAVATDGVEHVIGDFRPSGFGDYKRETGDFDFTAYATSTRADGLPVDGWLRSVKRLGGEFLSIDPRAMVIPASLEQVAEFATTYQPEKWWQVTDQTQIAKLIEQHQPTLDIASIDEVWECGETGTWFLDTTHGTAVYIESNVWGELPLKADQKEQAMTEQASREEVVQPNYDLEAQEFDALQQAMLERIEADSDVKGIHAVWVKPHSIFANLVRTLEAQQFPEITEFVSPVVEERSRFLALVDTRDDQRRIVHGFRVSGIGLDESQTQVDQAAEDDPVGIVMVDEMIESGQGLTAREFREYYQKAGIVVRNCLSVETNFRVGEKVENEGLRVSDLGYIAIFNLIDQKIKEPGHEAIFAYLNDPAIKSLQAIGVQSEPFVGRPELRAPGAEEDFDGHYVPVAIPSIQANLDVFRAIAPFGAPEIVLD